jgi:hypothetical protein
MKKLKLAVVAILLLSLLLGCNNTLNFKGDDTMPYPYVKNTFVNGTTPAISQTALNNSENQIELLTNNQGDLTSVTVGLNTQNKTDLTQAISEVNKFNTSNLIANNSAINSSFDASNSSLLGWSTGETITTTVSTSVSKYTSNSALLAVFGTIGYLYQDLTITNGHKLHVRAWVYKNSGTGMGFVAHPYGLLTSGINIMTTTAFNALSTSAWNMVSGEFTTANGGVRLLFGSLQYGTYNANVDGVMVIDKTAIFGSGNEPTTAQMDALIDTWFGGYFTTTPATNGLSSYGTFKPLLGGSTTDGTVTYTSSGYYTKVGNTITFSLEINVSSVSSAPTGIIKIKNLPFSGNSNINYQYFNCIAYSSVFWSNNGSYITGEFNKTTPNTFAIMTNGDNIPGFGAAYVLGSSVVSDLVIRMSGTIIV